MKKIKPIFIIFISLFLMFGCTKEDLEEFQAGANCDVNHTAVVVFENRSTSGKTYDILWNNVKIATLAPGKKTKAEAYSAGTHTYVFRKTGTTINACNPGYPNLAQCSSYTFWCEQ